MNPILNAYLQNFMEKLICTQDLHQPQNSCLCFFVPILSDVLTHRIPFLNDNQKLNRSKKVQIRAQKKERNVAPFSLHMHIHITPHHCRYGSPSSHYRYCMIHQFYYCLTNTGLYRSCIYARINATPYLVASSASTSSGDYNKEMNDENMLVCKMLGQLVDANSFCYSNHIENKQYHHAHIMICLLYLLGRCVDVLQQIQTSRLVRLSGVLLTGLHCQLLHRQQHRVRKPAKE